MMNVSTKATAPQLSRAVVYAVPADRREPQQAVRNSWIRYAAIRAARPELPSDVSPFPLSWIATSDAPYDDLYCDCESLQSAAARYGEHLWNYGRALEAAIDHGARLETLCSARGEDLDLAQTARAFYAKHRATPEAVLCASPELLMHEGLGNDAALTAYLVREPNAERPDRAEVKARREAQTARVVDFICEHRALQQGHAVERIELWPDAALGVSDAVRCVLSVPAAGVVRPDTTSLAADAAGAGGVAGATDAAGADGNAGAADATDADDAAGGALGSYLHAYDAFAQEHQAYVALLRAVVGLVERSVIDDACPDSDEDGIFYRGYNNYHALWDHAWVLQEVVEASEATGEPAVLEARDQAEGPAAPAGSAAEAASVAPADGDAGDQPSTSAGSESAADNVFPDDLFIDDDYPFGDLFEDPTFYDDELGFDWGDVYDDASGCSFAVAFEPFMLARLAELVEGLEDYEAAHPGVSAQYFGALGDPESCLDYAERTILLSSVPQAQCDRVRRARGEGRARAANARETAGQTLASQEDADGKANAPEEDAIAPADLVFIQLLNATYKADELVRRIAAQESALESEFQQVDVEDVRGVWHRTSLVVARARRNEAWWNLGDWARKHPEAQELPLLQVPAYRARWEQALARVEHAGRSA